MAKFWKDFRRMLPSLLISGILVAAILYFVDLKETVEAIKSASYSLLLLVLGVGLLQILVRGLVWRTLLRNCASYRDVFLTLMEGYLLNNFLPFRLGEIGRAFLISRKSDLKFAEILPTIIVERMTDLAFSAAIFIVAMPFVVGAGGTERIGFIVAGAVTVGLVAMYLLSRNRQWAINIYYRLSQRWPSLQQSGGNLLEAFFTGLEILSDIRLFVRFLLLMTLNWGIAVVQYYLLSPAFFPQATLIWGLFVLGAASFGGAIPSLPGGIGTLEGALGGALTLLSRDQSTALAAALTSRVLIYLYSSIFGLYGLSREGQTFSDIYQQLLKFQTHPTKIVHESETTQK